MKLPLIVTKYLFGWGMLAGALIMLIITSITSTPLTANISDEALTVRSNGVIKTQLEEIKRLRALLQTNEETNTTSENQNTPSSNAVTNIANSCTTHNDCSSITSICQAGTCQALQNPSCACVQGGEGMYILCVANEGLGTGARTISCGSNTCIEDPTPHCVTQ
jgi:hypothetical protein